MREGQTASGSTEAGGDGRTSVPRGALDAAATLALLENDGGWLWESDARHRICFLSEGYFSATEIDPARVPGHPRLDRLLGTAGPDGGLSGHFGDLEARRPFRDFIYEVREGSEACRWVSVSGVPRFDADGTFLGYRGTGRNATALLSMAEEARRQLSLRESRERLPDDERVGRSHVGRLRSALDAMQDAFCYYDADDRLVLFNEAMVAMHAGLEDVIRPGASFEELMEAALAREIWLTGDAGRDGFRDHVLDKRRNEQRSETLLAFRDGRRAVHRQMRTADGGVIGICTDVTDYKRRESELAEATQRAELLLGDLRRSLDAMNLGVVILDARLNTEFVNKAFFDIWQVAPEEAAIGSPFRALMDFNRHNGVYDVTDAQWEPYVASRLDEIRKGDVAPREFARADGRTMIYSVTALSGGKRLVSYYDITPMKRRETESQGAHNFLAAVLESLPAGIIIYDSDDRFVLANRKLQDMLPKLAPVWEKGRTFREALELGHEAGYFRTSGAPEVDALYAQDYEAWVEAYMRRHHLAHSVYERRNPDGRWYQAIDTRMPDGSFIGIRIDITELKEREAELREAQQKAVLADRAKSEFLANMSHEIRTPMNGVLGMAELLARSELDQRQQTFTDIIVKSGNALLTIINDILDFSKIDAGQLVLDPAPFHLAEAIEDVATLVSTRAKEKDLELIVRVEPGLHDHFVGDVGRIRQIITNLLGNAVKFTDAGHALVDVTGEDRGAEMALHVAVTDTGIGIPEDKLGHVFDKFSQVDASSTRRHEGTGLGLAITSRLVEMMGGEIGARSREGEGSTFWFTIALPKAGASGKERTMPIDVSGARILVIDDNAVNRSILLEQMASWGFDACAAESGPEGIAVMKAVAAHGLTLDCVILDYQMPGMTGTEVARVVRATPEIAGTPIVMLTSVDQSPGQQGSRALGIDAHLIKPARSSALLEALVSTIQKHRARRGGLPAQDIAPARPAAAAPEAGKPAASADPGPGIAREGHRVDILVAEDNEVNQLVFTQILGETGLTWEIVGNGRLAVEARRAMNPRMILMDVSMPEMNGLEATAKIREAEALSGGHVPIVGVTAHALKGDRERCIEAGMDDYLSKPISPGALAEKIGRWINGAAGSERIAG